MQNPVTQALNLGYRSENAPNVDAVINLFFYTHPYVKGSRTNTMLKLGQYLRWRGVQSWQLDNAIHTACTRGVEPGITRKEIERAGGTSMARKVEKCRQIGVTRVTLIICTFILTKILHNHLIMKTMQRKKMMRKR